VAASAITAPRPFRGRLCLLLGIALAVLGVFASLVQTSLGRLTVPWYMPVLGLLGAILIVISLFERRTIWRALSLLAVLLLLSAELAMLYVLRLPPYAGPITVGRAFPAFETMRADGTPFAQSNLAGERNNVLVFFRGRW
jgi:hypothetical protein